MKTNITKRISVALLLATSLLAGSVGMSHDYGCSSTFSDVGLQLSMLKAGWYLVTVNLDSVSHQNSDSVQAQLLVDGVPQIGVISQGIRSAFPVDVELNGSHTWLAYCAGPCVASVQARSSGPATVRGIGTSITAVYAGLDVQ